MLKDPTESSGGIPFPPLSSSTLRNSPQGNPRRPYATVASSHKSNPPGGSSSSPVQSNGSSPAMMGYPAPGANHKISTSLLGHPADLHLNPRMAMGGPPTPPGRGGGNLTRPLLLEETSGPLAPGGFGGGKFPSRPLVPPLWSGGYSSRPRPSPKGCGGFEGGDRRPSDSFGPPWAPLPSTLCGSPPMPAMTDPSLGSGAKFYHRRRGRTHSVSFHQVEASSRCPPPYTHEAPPPPHYPAGYIRPANSSPIVSLENTSGGARVKRSLSRENQGTVHPKTLLVDSLEDFVASLSRASLGHYNLLEIEFLWHLEGVFQSIDAASSCRLIVNHFASITTPLEISWETSLPRSLALHELAALLRRSRYLFKVERYNPIPPLNNKDPSTSPSIHLSTSLRSNSSFDRSASSLHSPLLTNRYWSYPVPLGSSSSSPLSCLLIAGISPLQLPGLRVLDLVGQRVCEISVNNAASVHLGQIMSTYATIHPTILRLGTLVTHWASRKLAPVLGGKGPQGIPGAPVFCRIQPAIEVMVIHFLLSICPELPTVSELLCDVPAFHFSEQNGRHKTSSLESLEPLSVLLVKFFLFYEEHLPATSPSATFTSAPRLVCIRHRWSSSSISAVPDNNLTSREDLPSSPSGRLLIVRDPLVDRDLMEGLDVSMEQRMIKEFRTMAERLNDMKSKATSIDDVLNTNFLWIFDPNPGPPGPPYPQVEFLHEPEAGQDENVVKKRIPSFSSSALMNERPLEATVAVHTCCACSGWRSFTLSSTTPEETEKREGISRFYKKLDETDAPVCRCSGLPCPCNSLPPGAAFPFSSAYPSISATFSSEGRGVDAANPLLAAELLGSRTLCQIMAEKVRTLRNEVWWLERKVDTLTKTHNLPTNAHISNFPSTQTTFFGTDVPLARRLCGGRYSFFTMSGGPASLQTHISPPNRMMMMAPGDEANTWSHSGPADRMATGDEANDTIFTNTVRGPSQVQSAGVRRVSDHPSDGREIRSAIETSCYGGSGNLSLWKFNSLDTAEPHGLSGSTFVPRPIRSSSSNMDPTSQQQSPSCFANSMRFTLSNLANHSTLPHLAHPPSPGALPTENILTPCAADEKGVWNISENRPAQNPWAPLLGELPSNLGAPTFLSPFAFATQGNSSGGEDREGGEKTTTTSAHSLSTCS